MTINHSDECNLINKSEDKSNLKNEGDNTIKNDKIRFINACNRVMDTSNIYDRKLFKELFINIYNTNDYKFPLNNDLLSNIINKWKNSSIRFTKNYIIWNMTDYENR